MRSNESSLWVATIIQTEFESSKSIQGEMLTWKLTLCNECIMHESHTKWLYHQYPPLDGAREPLKSIFSFTPVQVVTSAVSSFLFDNQH